MKKLTVWMTCDGTKNVLVAAGTKTEAARLMNRSLYSFNQFALDLYAEHPDAVMALEHPLTVFECSNRGPGRDWKTQAACPHDRVQPGGACDHCGEQVYE